MVPGLFQSLLWRAYVPGQETTKKVSNDYLLIQTVCRLLIAQKERLEDVIVKRLIDEVATRAFTAPVTPFMNEVMWTLRKHLEDEEKHGEIKKET